VILVVKAIRREVVLAVEDWAEIRRLHFGEKLGIKAIERRLGLARNTVRKAVRRSTPPAYERPLRSSRFDQCDLRVRGLLAEFPDMPASVIAERVGWTHSESVFRERVAILRPLYTPPEPYQRTEYEPGELAQWDLWFPDVDIPIGDNQVARFPVLVGTSGYSRTMAGRMIPSRESSDLLEAHWQCLQDFGAVPRAGVYDNEGAIGRNRGRAGTKLTPAFQAFRGVLGMKAIVLRARFPEGKGVVERSNGYLETSFLPGRTFTSIDDFNVQFTSWLNEKANHRFHRTLRCRPSERMERDRAAMMPLPPVAPDVAFHFSTRIARDHYVRVHTCDYSVHPKAIGRTATVRASLTTVVVTVAGEEVARHHRCLVKHQALTDPVHDAARKQLQQERQLRAEGQIVAVEVEERDLDVYDRLLGVA
jgi:transposase